MDLIIFVTAFLCITSCVNGAVTANDDIIYVDPDTPICINVLSNDYFNSSTPNITAVTNGTKGGFGFLYTKYSPFFITSTSNMAVIEAENYEQINFRNFPSYNGIANNTSWQDVTYNLYSTLQGAGGVRAWPNTGVNTGSGNAGPALRYNLALRAAGNYYVNVRGQPCMSCNTAYGNCTGCTSMTTDNTLYFLTDEGATNFVSTGYAIKDWSGSACMWSEFKITWTVSNSTITWPPQLTPFYLAMRDDGAVVDRFIVSTAASAANGTSVGPAATQYVSCASTDILYFPAKGYSGTDNVTYTIYDGTGSSSATVRVYVGVTPPTPSVSPSVTPTSSRTPSPTPSPSSSPSATPSCTPSNSPSVTPSISISASPGSSSSTTPSVTPSISVSTSPSPTASVTPTSSVSASPSSTTSVTPTSSKTPSASITPAASPSSSVTTSPSASNSPSVTPTPSMSISPSEEPQKSSKKNNATPIIAGVVVAAGVCVGAALLAVFIIRRKKKQSPQHHPEIELSTRRTSKRNFVLTKQATNQESNGENSTTYISVAAETNAYYDAFGEHDKRKSNPNNNNRVSERISTAEMKNAWDIDFSEIKITRKLGEGAFGEVWEGKWKGSHVAVKKLLTSGNDAEFLAEAELMKKMRPHPNVVLFIGVCSDPLCLVTEYVANGDLLSFLQKGSVTDEMRISITQGIAAGMFYLHQQGVIHRDLAARNILLDKTNNPKVSDFGMSRVAVQESGHKTQTNFGPIRWMAPEALSERMYNVKTDVWSFGVVIYEILTCSLPYHQIDLAQVAIQVSSNKISLVHDVEKQPDKYPKKLVTVMTLCLQHQAADRPDFSQIVDLLE